MEWELAISFILRRIDTSSPLQRISRTVSQQAVVHGLALQMAFGYHQDATALTTNHAWKIK